MSYFLLTTEDLVELFVFYRELRDSENITLDPAHWILVLPSVWTL